MSFAVHRARFEVANAESGLYRALETTAARHPSETAERFAARLVAWALCWEPELVFTGGVSSGDEPDVWSHGPDGRLHQWIEVGLPESERLVKAARRSEQVRVYAYGARVERWWEEAAAKLAGLPRLEVHHLEPVLLEAFGGELPRSIEATLTLAGGVLYVARSDGSVREAPCVRLGAAPDPT